MVVLGTTSMPVHQVMRLSRGAIIELDATEEDEVKVLANNLPIASGVCWSTATASRSKSSTCCPPARHPLKRDDGRAGFLAKSPLNRGARRPCTPNPDLLHPRR